MKTQARKNKLVFTKGTISELNDNLLYRVNGGSETSISMAPVTSVITERPVSFRIN